MGAAQKEGDCGILQGGGERKRDRPKNVSIVERHVSYTYKQQ